MNNYNLKIVIKTFLQNNTQHTEVCRRAIDERKTYFVPYSSVAKVYLVKEVGNTHDRKIAKHCEEIRHGKRYDEAVS